MNHCGYIPLRGYHLKESHHPTVRMSIHNIEYRPHTDLMHPIIGIQVCDTVLPAGTNLGCSAWTLHRETEVWGEDADTWRPERWIDASDAKKSEMKNSMFAFGAGARTCIGKNISYLEMYKLVPAFLRAFDVSRLHNIILNDY